MATVAMFLPAFVFVAVVGRFADRIRDRPLTAALLDGVNAAALGLMAAVSVQLGLSAVRDPLTIVLFLVSGMLLWSGRVPSLVLVGAGGLVGLAATAAGIGP